MKSKLVAIQCLSFGDISMAVYTYFSLSNFDEFKKVLILSTHIDAPDFQVQLYKVFLQTLTFLSIALVLIHLIIYYFFYREKKFAKAYVKYYAVMAGFSLLGSAFFLKQNILFLPAVIYLYGLYHILKHDPLTKSNSKSKIVG